MKGYYDEHPVSAEGHACNPAFLNSPKLKIHFTPTKRRILEQSSNP
jgi:hypothetical protein